MASVPGQEITPEQMVELLHAQLDKASQKAADDAATIADLQAKLGIREQSSAEKLANIENLSHADLKASKDDLVKVAAALPPDEVAARYVQARTDARLRDQRMGEMGQQITDLTAQVADLTAQLQAATKQATDLAGQLASAGAALEAERAAHVATKEAAVAVAEKAEG